MEHIDDYAMYIPPGRPPTIKECRFATQLPICKVCPHPLFNGYEWYLVRMPNPSFVPQFMKAHFPAYHNMVAVCRDMQNEPMVLGIKFAGVW